MFLKFLFSDCQSYFFSFRLSLGRMFEQKSPGEIHVVAVVGLFWEVGRLLAPTNVQHHRRPKTA
jgi:hypothetical protein